LSHLGRSLGLLEALSIGIGSMIGAGIFVLSGSAAQAAGPAALISFALAGGSVLLTALCFAELATAMPRAGGPYVFVKEAFGDAWGFFVGWSLWVGLALATAFYCLGFAQYLNLLLPGVPPRAAAAAVALVLVGVNLTGARGTARLQNGMVLALVAILGYYIVRSLPVADASLRDPFLPYGWAPVVRSASTVFVSYLGFELIATAAEEMKNPRRDLPLATFLSIVVVVAIYVLVMYTATGLLSHYDLGKSPTPIADAARVAIGPAGAVLLVVAGLLATLSSANTSIMASSRVGWAMAQDALLPHALGRVYGRWRSPLPAVLATGAFTLLALTPDDARQLAGAAGFLHLYPFIVINAALLKLRTKPGYQPSFRVRGGAAVPLLAAAVNAFLLSKVALPDALWGALLIAPGLVYQGVRSACAGLGWRRGTIHR